MLVLQIVAFTVFPVRISEKNMRKIHLCAYIEIINCSPCLIIEIVYWKQVKNQDLIVNLGWKLTPLNVESKCILNSERSEIRSFKEFSVYI